MLKPRKREGIKTFYFTTNTFSIRVAQYKANPKASIYFCDAKGFKGMMLRGTMEVLTDAKSKEMIWHNGDEQYYPGGVTDPNYCVLTRWCNRPELLRTQIHRHRWSLL